MEFGHGLGKLAACPHLLVHVFQLPLDLLDHLERPEDVAVPEVPRDPFQLVVQFRQVVIRRNRDQFLELLSQHRDAHREVKPVEPLLSQRAQIQLEVTYVVATVGEEGDRLIHLEPLRLEQFGQPTLGFRGVARHKAKAFRISLGGHTLTDDEREPAGRAVVAVAGVDVAAVNADGEWTIWPGQCVPISLAARDEERLLIAQLAFQPLSHLLGMAVDRGHSRLERQHLLHDVDGHSKGQEGCPLRFQVAPLRRRPFGQAFRERAAAMWAVNWLTRASPEARAVQAERTEQRADDDLMVSFAPASRATCGAGLLRRQIGCRLLRHHRLLHASEDGLALGQREAESLVRQLLPRQGGHLRHDCGSIPWFDDELHRDLHQHASSSV